MNLTSFFRRDAAVEDHSLVDHSWMQGDILDIESMRNPNNVKPELEVEWGLGGPNIDLDEPAGEVQRNEPDVGVDTGSVILFARDMMNRGCHGRDVVSSLRKRFPPAVLAKSAKGLRNMFALEGLVGRVMVDARGYKSCQDAMKSASTSPSRGFIKYVFGCCCGDPHILPVNEEMSMGEGLSSGNPTDDFLASGDKTTARVASHCRSTMLPILSAQGDLDKSFLDGTLIELMNTTTIPESVIGSIKSMKVSNLAKARAAFRWLDAQKSASDDGKYAGKVDASEFKLKKADNEIEFFDAPESDIPVDESPASMELDVELFDSPLEVEMNQFEEPEFVGGDEVMLEDVSVAPAPMDVEMLSRPDDDLGI